MKAQVITLSILLVAVCGFRSQNQNFLTKNTLRQSSDEAEDVELDSDDVPTILSPSANEAEMLSDGDETESSCKDLMKKHRDQYDSEDDDDEESDEDSDSDEETLPCDNGQELTEEQLQACQDFCEDGDCECVDQCHDLMEFVGDAATGLLEYLADYFEEMNEMRSLAAQAYQNAILNTLGNFYGAIENSTSSLSSAFDFDFDLENDQDQSDYTDDIEDASNDDSSDDEDDDDEDDDDEDEDDDDQNCDCNCEDKQKNGSPCACAHLVHEQAQKNSPVLKIVGSALSSKIQDDSDSSSL